jgi:peptidoglycan/xylan/chitin deacetylase (PgdA/CDA1 family)
MPVTVFLCSGFIDANRRFWFSAPGLSDTERQHLKTVPDDDRLVALRAMGFTEATEFGDRESLNASEITELRHLIDFQSHSVTHPILPACSDEKAKSEILLSRQQLEQLELRVNALAYPNGNYTPRETRYAQDAGYLCGLTMDAGFNARGTPQYALKRLTVKDDCGVDELMVRACGLWEFARFAARPAKGRVPATREWIPAS